MNCSCQRTRFLALVDFYPHSCAPKSLSPSVTSAGALQGEITHRRCQTRGRGWLSLQRVTQRRGGLRGRDRAQLGAGQTPRAASRERVAGRERRLGPRAASRSDEVRLLCQPRCPPRPTALPWDPPRRPPHPTPTPASWPPWGEIFPRKFNTELTSSSNRKNQDAEMLGLTLSKGAAVGTRPRGRRGNQDPGKLQAGSFPARWSRQSRDPTRAYAGSATSLWLWPTASVGTRPLGLSWACALRAVRHIGLCSTYWLLNNLISI